MHLIRIVVVAFCAYAIWWSNRIAVADLAASTVTTDGFAKAMKIAPEDPELRMKEALHRADEDEAGNSSAVDEDLRGAAKLNPMSSDLLMTIGLREEFRGDVAGAERDLTRAVEVDRQFKPAWTLANFYYRRQDFEKSRPFLKQILALNPLGFDPNPVFELAWSEAGSGDEMANSAKVQELIPPGEKRIQYLEFLIKSKRTEAAIAEWPAASASFSAEKPEQVSVLTGMVDFLIRERRMDAAVKVWNELVDRGVEKGGRLEPEKGVSIADPEFQFPLNGMAFLWRLEDVPGVFGSRIAGGLRFEISGEEPENFILLRTMAPVMPGKQYRLRWSADGAGLNSAHDPGFAFEIAEGPGDKATVMCPPVLPSGNTGCTFTSPSGGGAVQVRLRYTRAQGTVRVSGVMQLDAVRLEMVK